MLKREGVSYYLKETVLFYTTGMWSQVCQENAPLAFGGKAGVSWDREQLGSDVQGAP